MPGALYGSSIRPPFDVYFAETGSRMTFAMASLNAGWSARIIALNTKDIKSVKLVWSSVSSPGQVTLRIETDDGKGKPSGSLYDANAVITGIVPSAGVQTYTFATTPTTGLTAGALYHVVVLTTTGGTTQTLVSGMSSAYHNRYPIRALTAADGTTRSNFTEVNYNPTASFILDDDSEDSLNCSPYYDRPSYPAAVLYGTIGIGSKITLLASVKVIGIHINLLVKVGTPAGGVIAEIRNSSDAVVSGTQVTLDKDQIGSAQSLYFPFVSEVTLAAGTYRIVARSPDSANSSNCWRTYYSLFISSAVVADNFRYTTCPDISSPSWTDSTTADIGFALAVSVDVAATGGGLITHAGMTGGVNG